MALGPGCSLPSWAGLTAVALLGCDEGQYRVILHVPGGAERAARVEVSVIPSCGEVATAGAPFDAPLRVVDVRGGQSPPLGSVRAGTYGLYGRAWDRRCVLFAAGCDTVHLEGSGDGTLDLYLEELSPPGGCNPGDRCEEGVCLSDGGLDAGDEPALDGAADGSFDAGGGPSHDAATDSGRDGSADGGPVRLCDPTIVGSIDFESDAEGVAVSGATAIVAAGGWVYLVDISDREEPAQVARVGANLARRVVSSGQYAFVANGKSAAGLFVLDAVDPANPARVDTVETPGTSLDVALSGSYAIVADEDYGLDVIDATIPASPVLVGVANTPLGARAVAAADAIAFAVDGEGGFQIASFSSPDSPELIGTLPGLGPSAEVAAWGSFVFVAVRDDSLVAIDVSDPEAPILVSSTRTSGEPTSVVVHEGYAFVTEGSSGLQIFDVVEPSEPELAGAIDTPGTALDLAVQDEWVVVADGAEGLQIVESGCRRRDR
ncbi:MAG: hypothetical protein HYY06_18415 [Deltaproteobacteria bacterium]|nr:hypothetical protein [Deltaproteobacteria bacterium]